jgi:hypothetical protein
VRVLRVDTQLEMIDQHFPDFVDDGLSCFPGWMFRRWRLRRAGRKHDWDYCSRCHPPGSMNQAARARADAAIKANAKDILPWILHPVSYLLRGGTSLFGGIRAWNSCGPSAGERCRHNMKQPVWMLALG